MGRRAGSGNAGKTRSTRLPRALDEWFIERLERHPEQSATELLVQLIHGGLRLREGYMAIHRRALEERGGPAAANAEYVTYARCLVDTFGQDYLDHLERWLEADRARPFRTAPNGVAVTKNGSR
jgi:hypothetical protein